MSSFVWHSRHTKELIFAILEEMMTLQPRGLGGRCAKIWVSGVRRRSRPCRRSRRPGCRRRSVRRRQSRRDFQIRRTWSRRRSYRRRAGNNSQAGDRWTGEAGEMQTGEAGDRRPWVHPWDRRDPEGDGAAGAPGACGPRKWDSTPGRLPPPDGGGSGYSACGPAGTRSQKSPRSAGPRRTR